MRKLSTGLAAKQAGFTLVELVIVIVIIGILAAVAIPNFLDVSDDAHKAVALGVAGAASSASANNRTACKGSLASCTAVGDCADIAGLITKPTDATIAAGAITTTANCTVSYKGQTATFVGYAAASGV